LACGSIAGAGVLRADLGNVCDSGDGVATIDSAGIAVVDCDVRVDAGALVHAARVQSADIVVVAGSEGVDTGVAVTDGTLRLDAVVAGALGAARLSIAIAHSTSVLEVAQKLNVGGDCDFRGPGVSFAVKHLECVRGVLGQIQAVEFDRARLSSMNSSQIQD